LNQIRTWVRQGRTDAWIAHQLEVSVPDIKGFKREHDLAPDTDNGDDAAGATDEPDLRAEDDALVAAALEAEAEDAPEAEDDDAADAADEAGDGDDGDGEDGEEAKDKPRRRRGRRGGRGRGKRRPKALEGTFDHGDEGYGLWLDPAIQDDPI
jgi:hypothetical protein